ncbi:MAG: quinolinate synthase [Acidobacteria bacterium]|nr:MAG: quinolinate synthase [Acidobacteriota bacterium]
MATAVSTNSTCSLDNYLVLPDRSMDARICIAREILGEQCVVLGHHYQRDEVIQFSDFQGDSWRLSELASKAKGQYIVFCGVHFMAESADILARPDQAVILPDLNAGCSMADMAEISQVENAWEQFVRLGLTTDRGDGITPLTYMNSTAAIKAFVGERGGTVCTSSNAHAAMKWAFERNGKILFLPDQHLGRNTGYALNIPLDEMVVWDPHQLQGGQSAEKLRKAKVILWKGHCSVHQRFLPEHADSVRERYEGIKVIVHPECRWEVCQKADDMGSTDKLRRLVAEAPAGAKFAIGTEIHLVNRLAKQNPDKLIVSLNDSGCLCTTMYRISPQHLAWSLENLVEDNVVNQIKVRSAIKHWAKIALDRMLQIKG